MDINSVHDGGAGHLKDNVLHISSDRTSGDLNHVDSYEAFALVDPTMRSKRSTMAESAWRKERECTAWIPYDLPRKAEGCTGEMACSQLRGVGPGH
jgi:hypothetical protein